MQSREETSLLLEEVINSIGSGVVVVDSQGNFILWNPAARQLLGKGPTNEPPERWSEIYGVYGDDGTTLLPVDELPLVRAMRGQSIDGLRVYVNNPDVPRGIWLSVNARPLADRAGGIVGGVIVFNDITSQKMVEKELMRSNNDLQEFASVAAHDLQEPLRTIGSFLELLSNRQKDKLDDKSLHYMQFINEAVERMQNLINDLLTYSRIQSRAKPFENVDCAKLVEEVLANLDTSIKESNAIINVDHLPTIKADRAQLMQVFQNLIANAIKFRSPERRLAIDIRAQKKRAHWIFSVQDNGIGISPKYGQRIFGLFQRLHPIDQYPGSGIGLSVCKRIVERHSGVIFVESKLGVGSSFYFTIGT